MGGHLMSSRVLFSALLRLSWVSLLKSWGWLAVYWFEGARDCLIEGYLWSRVRWGVSRLSRVLGELKSWLQRSLHSLESWWAHLADLSKTLFVWIWSSLGLVRFRLFDLLLVNLSVVSLWLLGLPTESEAAGVDLAAPASTMIASVRVLLALAWKEVTLIGGRVVRSVGCLRFLRRNSKQVHSVSDVV